MKSRAKKLSDQYQWSFRDFANRANKKLRFTACLMALVSGSGSLLGGCAAMLPKNTSLGGGAVVINREVPDARSEGLKRTTAFYGENFHSITFLVPDKKDLTEEINGFIQGDKTIRRYPSDDCWPEGKANSVYSSNGITMCTFTGLLKKIVMPYGSNWRGNLTEFIKPAPKNATEESAFQVHSKSGPISKLGTRVK